MNAIYNYIILCTNRYNNSKKIEDKMIGCAAIILVGLSYKDEKNFKRLLSNGRKFGLDITYKTQSRHPN